MQGEDGEGVKRVEDTDRVREKRMENMDKMGEKRMRGRDVEKKRVEDTDRVGEKENTGRKKRAGTESTVIKRRDKKKIDAGTGGTMKVI
jgi:hypothetical protein